MFFYDASQTAPRLLSAYDMGTSTETDYIYGPTGTPVEAVDDAAQAPSYYLSDRRGSLRLVVDSAGAYVGNAGYDPYGIESASGAMPAIGYIGGYVSDTGTGLNAGLEYLTPISTQGIPHNVQGNSKRRTLPPHHGTTVSEGRLALRSTGE